MASPGVQYYDRPMPGLSTPQAAQLSGQGRGWADQGSGVVGLSCGKDKRPARADSKEQYATAIRRCRALRYYATDRDRPRQLERAGSRALGRDRPAADVYGAGDSRW